MKTRLTALALAGAMLLALAACGSQETVQPTPSPELSDQPTGEVTATPQATDSVEVETETPEVSAGPSESVQPSEPPAGESAPPSPTPSAIGDPTAPPSEEPAKDLTAASLYNLWDLSSSHSPSPGAGFIDMSARLDAYYDLDADDLESFVFYQPDMSSSLQEVLLAKAKPGKASSVKAACQSRLEGLREEAEFYPGTSEFVDAAELESVGDWVVLAACSEADRLVKILKDTAN